MEPPTSGLGGFGALFSASLGYSAKNEKYLKGFEILALPNPNSPWA